MLAVRVEEKKVQWRVVCEGVLDLFLRPYAHSEQGRDGRAVARPP